jgi:ParB-like chromosome segregation protein Spo0J
LSVGFSHWPFRDSICTEETMRSKSKKTNRQTAAKGGRIDTKNQRIESRPVDSLHPHPKQPELFPDLPEHEFQALVEDIRKNGIRIPPQILPDGTILVGHQRTRAARVLGFEKIDVVVRDDLKDAGEAAVLDVFLGDNLLRRHLSTLRQAKCAIELAELDCNRKALFSDCQRQAVIEKGVMHRLRCSRKTAQRYIWLSKGPEAIQEAHERDLLPLVQAVRASALQPNVREKLATSISRLLKQVNAQGTLVIEKQIRTLVQTAIGTSKPRKPVRPPSPSLPLYEMKACLDVHVDVVQANKATIIEHLRGDKFDPELNPGSADLPYAAAMKSFRRQILPELRERCSSLAETLDEIANAIEPAADEANGDGSSSDTVSD